MTQRESVFNMVAYNELIISFSIAAASRTMYWGYLYCVVMLRWRETEGQSPLSVISPMSVYFPYGGVLQRSSKVQNSLSNIWWTAWWFQKEHLIINVSIDRPGLRSHTLCNDVPPLFYIARQRRVKREDDVKQQMRRTCPHAVARTRSPVTVFDLYTDIVLLWLNDTLRNVPYKCFFFFRVAFDFVEWSHELWVIFYEENVGSWWRLWICSEFVTRNGKADLHCWLDWSLFRG